MLPPIVLTMLMMMLLQKLNQAKATVGWLPTSGWLVGWLWCEEMTMMMAGAAAAHGAITARARARRAARPVPCRKAHSPSPGRTLLAISSHTLNRTLINKPEPSKTRPLYDDATAIYPLTLI
eukprot:scaffold1681_cov242-Prasinococcus_capsulatus_cf.AAC.4